MIKLKEITAKQLCDGYKKCATDNLKTKFFKDNFKLRTEYIPYIEKVSLAEAIMKYCCYMPDKNGDNTYVKVSSPFKYLFTVRTIISSYTNIVYNDSLNKSFIEEYDMLASCGLIDIILNSIPEKELKEFYTVCNMVYEDIMINYYEAHGFISGAISRLSSVLDKTSTPFFDVLAKKVSEMSTEEISKKIMKMIQKVK